MDDWQIRTKMLIGDHGARHLENATVAVFGLGGVGSYIAESLARSGIGHLWLIDADTVSISNINRQLVALHSTKGQMKTDIMRERIMDINPYADVKVFPVFYCEDMAGEFDLSQCDFIADAIDTVSAKLLLVEEAGKSGVPVISCMGTGNKMNPSMLEVTDIYKTSVCPLARVMRYELRKRGVDSLKVVYSKETPKAPLFCPEDTGQRARGTPSSMTFVPASAGLLIASEIVKYLIK